MSYFQPVIRPVTLEDLPALQELYAEAWLRLCSEIGFPMEEEQVPVLGLEGNRGFLAEDETGAPLGFALIREELIEKLYVASKSRGCRVGTALLLKAMEAGASTLHVDEGNRYARDFYESHGWKPTGESHRGGLVKSMVLEYKLGPATKEQAHPLQT